jgi:outer membrane protein assembly factor BamA
MTRTMFIKMLAIALAFSFCNTLAGQASQPEDPAPVKTGWTFGALPAVSYNSDLGFQYGGLVNLYYFGDGSSFPKYMHSIYAEISRYTKGSGVNRLFYDSNYLLPGLRVTADLSYFTEKALDFYGFNGYNAFYSPAFEDESNGDDYLSRMFYRHERNMFRFTLDFQGRLSGNSLRWIGGLGLMNTAISPVDIASLNKGKEPEDMLPEIPGLYEKYVDWNLISEGERRGGNTHHLKLGIVYDTRDNEPNPMRGIWSEAVVFAAPGFMGNGDFAYSRLSVTHRQYFTIIKNDLSFAYRLNYQGTLGGNVPFYMLPYMINSFSLSSNTDGLGGSRTVRGVLRNRVVGEGMAFGNFELRWKFHRTTLFRQNTYLALNVFSDAGMVVTQRKIADNGLPGLNGFYTDGKESLHNTVGGGFRIAMNENFIVAADYGVPLDKRDGGGGLYIGLNYLF